MNRLVFPYACAVCGVVVNQYRDPRVKNLLYNWYRCVQLKVSNAEIPPVRFNSLKSGLVRVDVIVQVFPSIAIIFPVDITGPSMT